MNKLKTFVCIAALIILAGPLLAQNNTVLDESLFQQKTAQFGEVMKQYQQTIMDSLQHIFVTNQHFFDDAQGKPDPGKLVIYLLKLQMPYHQQSINSWAEAVFNKDEYAHFLTMKFKTLQGSGIPVITTDGVIDYDERWLYDFEINITLSLMADFNVYEHYFHLTGYDLTGNIMPRYLVDIIGTNDPTKMVANGAANIAYDFFVFMHEFYHSYYEHHRGVQTQDEFAADQYAINKWSAYTRDKDSKNLVTDTYLNQLNKVMKTKDNLLFVKKETGCYTQKLINQGVTNEEFNSAFLGERTMEMLLLDDTRFLLTKPDQVVLDIERADSFMRTAYKNLKCKGTDSSFFCCNLAVRAEGLANIKQLAHTFQTISKTDFSPEGAFYRKLDASNPSLVAMVIGNYYLLVKKDYNQALTYYASVNQLGLADKDQYAVLCNLFAYEIYNTVQAKKNPVLAKEFLEKAKTLNLQTPAIRSTIINSLTID